VLGFNTLMRLAGLSSAVVAAVVVGVAVIVVGVGVVVAPERSEDVEGSEAGNRDSFPSKSGAVALGRNLPNWSLGLCFALSLMAFLL